MSASANAEQELAAAGARLVRHCAGPASILVDNGFRKMVERAIRDATDPLTRLRLTRVAVNTYRSAGWPWFPLELDSALVAQFENAKEAPLKARPLAEWARLRQQVLSDREGHELTPFQKRNERCWCNITDTFVMGGSAEQLRQQLANHVNELHEKLEEDDFQYIDYLVAAEDLLWARALIEGIDREGEDFVAAMRDLGASPASAVAAAARSEHRGMLMKQWLINSIMAASD